MSNSEIKRLATQLTSKQVDEKIAALEEQVTVVDDKLALFREVRKVKQTQAAKVAKKPAKKKAKKKS